MKFIHAADVHLDAPLQGLTRYPGVAVDDARASTRHAFAGLVDLAIDEEASFVVIAGDLFDGACRDYNTALFLTTQASRLREAEIPLILALGNHDAASVLTKQLRLPDKTTVLDARTPSTVLLEEVGVAVHGQSFARREVFDNLVAAYPAPRSDYLNVGLLHTSLNGRPGHAGYAPCSIEELRASGYDYWALGHVHSREQLSTDPWIVFSGCTQGRHIREVGAKGASVVTFDGGAISAVEHRELDLLRWCLLEVDATDLDEDALFDAVREAVISVAAEAEQRLVVARVVVTGATPTHRALVAERERYINEIRALMTDAAPEQVWLERLRIETRTPTDVARLVARDDAVGGLLRALRTLPTDDEGLTALSSELGDLRRRLPVDVQDDEFDLGAPTTIARLVKDVEHLLLARLAGVAD